MTHEESRITTNPRATQTDTAPAKRTAQCGMRTAFESPPPLPITHSQRICSRARQALTLHATKHAAAARVLRSRIRLQGDAVALGMAAARRDGGARDGGGADGARLAEWRAHATSRARARDAEADRCERRVLEWCDTVVRM